MTELAQEQEKQVDMIYGYEIRQTNAGDIIFINTGYVTPKTINILVASINEMIDVGNRVSDSHGMYTVVFRIDGIPRIKQDEMNTWVFNPDAKCAICNLSDCIELAYANTMDEDKEDAVYCNVEHIMWKHLITGFFHEAHHANAFIDDYATLISDEDARQVEELRADEFADMHSFHMAKLMDTEPEFSPTVEHMLEEQWAEYGAFISEDDKADDHSKLWLMVQTHMKQYESSFFLPAKEDSDEDHFECKTFKEFMKWCSKDPDDESWDVDTAIPTTGIEVKISIPDPNLTAEGNPAAIANTGGTPVMDAFNAEYGDSLPFEPGNTVPTTPGMQGVTQQFTPNAPVAPTTPVAPNTQAIATNTTIDAQSTQINPAIGQFQATVKTLYIKMFNHIFQACGYNPQMEQVFSQKEKISDMLPLTTEEAAIVSAMDCYNELGQEVKAKPCENWLSGIFIDKAQQLPGYIITLTTLEGAQVFRKFVPQNPNKVNFETKQPTKPALEAKAGNQIMWVIDPVNPKGAIRVYNGVYQRQDGYYNWVAI